MSALFTQGTKAPNEFVGVALIHALKGAAKYKFLPRPSGRG